MLSLVSDLFGPIFAKELVEMARRWRYYLSRVLFGAVLLIVLLVVHEEQRGRYLYRGGMTAKTLAYLAEQFFLAFCWVQYLAVYLFVPLFLSGVIAGEREQKTLDLLFTTQLKNRQIVWGKLGSRIVSLLMILLSGLPVVAITMLFGGVNPTIFFRVTCATLLALLFTSAFSIYFSTTTRTPLGALLRTYWWLALWTLIVPWLFAVLSFVMSGPFVGTRDTVMTVICLADPVGTFAAALEDSFWRNLLRMLGPGYFWLLFIIPTLWSLFLIWRSVRLVRTEPRPGKWWPRIKAALKATAAGVVRQDRERKVSPYRLGNPERVFGLLPVSNPFWLRARRARVYDRDGHLRRILWAVVLCTTVFLLLMLRFEPRGLRDDDASMTFLGILWGILGVLGCLLAGYSFVGERRRGFLELVLTTPLTPSEILRGTFLTVWRHVSLLYLLILVIGFVFLGASGIGIFTSLITGTLFFCLMIYHGMAVSLTARTIPGALVGAFCLPLVTIIALMILIGFTRHASGPILWVLCATLLPLSSLAVHYRVTLPRVTVFLLMIHLTLGSLCSFWTWNAHRHFEYPVAAMHPAFLTLSALENRSWRYLNGAPSWVGVLCSYWLCLVLNLIWLHFWVCRHFDRLTGRTDGSNRRPRARITTEKRSQVRELQAASAE